MLFREPARVVWEDPGLLDEDSMELLLIGQLEGCFMGSPAAANIYLEDGELF